MTIDAVSLFLEYGAPGAGEPAWCIFTGREFRFRVFINGSQGYEPTHVEILPGLTPVDAAEAGSKGLQMGDELRANEQKC